MLVQHFGPDSTIVQLITMKFCSEIHGSQSMNPADFGF